MLSQMEIISNKDNHLTYKDQQGATSTLITVATLYFI